jgi:hypothetical protein
MSRLCRLKTKTHGEDGQWAYEEITRLRELLREAREVMRDGLDDYWMTTTSRGYDVIAKIDEVLK